MSNSIVELFGHSTYMEAEWQTIIATQHCPYLKKKCIKIRKSQPDIAIGSCIVQYGREAKDLVSCPHRYLHQSQIFLDCLHLLTLHEPGNALHKISEVDIPGGSVDYFLVSAQAGKVVDFVGIELQSLDTTGTVWPARQHFLAEIGLPVQVDDSSKSFGINWKMTAKTTLVQLHHKIATFEGLGKHLVLILQDALLAYMRREFQFGHIQAAKLGHAMHFHAYALTRDEQQKTRLRLQSRTSTDADGMAIALGLKASPDLELAALIAALEAKITDETFLEI